MFVIGWLLNVSSINNGDTLKCLFIFSRVIIEVRKCIIGGSYGILNIGKDPTQYQHLNFESYNRE